MKINNSYSENIEPYAYKMNKKEAEIHSSLGDIYKEKDLSREKIDDILDKLNKTFDNQDERITFSYHEKTNRIIIKVMNTKTNEVVREIPPKDIIKLVENIQDYLGLLFDESR